jgi:hypothetical protein
LILLETTASVGLALDAIGQVAPVTVGHDDAQLLATLGKERVLVPDNVRVRKSLHQLDLVPTGHSLSLWYVSQLDALHAVMSILTNVAAQVDFAKGALANLANDFVIL